MTTHDDPAGSDLARSELRSTFEAQIERLREIDNKAIEILKANLLLIGIFVTGISILVQTGIQIDAFVNPFTVVAGFLLLCSTALAGVTYTASNLRGGLDGGSVRRAVAGGYSDREFERSLTESYGRWIEYNAEVTAVNDLLITVTVLLVIDAFVYLLAGIVIAVISPSIMVVSGGFLGLTVGLIWVSRRVFHMDHLNHGGPEPPFEGIRLSKGATRRNAIRALLRMLRPSDETDDSQYP